MTAAGLPLAEPGQVREWCKEILSAARGQIALILGLSVTALAVGLIGPRLLGHLVESVVAGTTVAHVNTIALCFVGVLVVETLLTRFARARAALLGEAVLAWTRERFVRRVLHLPLAKSDAIRPGDLLSRATSDVEHLDESIRHAVPRIGTAALSVLITVGAMLLSSPLLTLVALTTVPLLAISLRWYRIRAARAYERLLADWADVRETTYETVQGAETVESLGLARRRVACGNAALTRAERTQRHAINLQTVFLPCLDLATLLPMAAMLLLGGLAYQKGLVGLAALVAMVLYVERLAEPLSDVVDWLDELQLGNAALRRILGVERLAAAPAHGAARPAHGGLSLRGVRFGYREGAEVLHGIDLDVPEGEFLAVVGSSGSGKSTLAKVIAGVHPPDAGTVSLGGAPIGEIPADLIRREVVMVTQEQHIFTGTVRDNLTLAGGDEEGSGAGDERLWEVLRAVEADGWVRSCPGRMGTELGSGRTQVPPAVAQQLALARLMLADPRVLILDEATAELDLSAARRIERSLAALLHGRTVIAIAHRMDIARLADRVLVVEHGRIAECGAHDELLAADGRYAQLWRAWSGTAGPGAMSPDTRPTEGTGAPPVPTMPDRGRGRGDGEGGRR